MLMPSATMATTDATGKRRSRTHGNPPMRAASTVIRVKVTTQRLTAAGGDRAIGERRLGSTPPPVCPTQLFLAVSELSRVRLSRSRSVGLTFAPTRFDRSSSRDVLSRDRFVVTAPMYIHCHTHQASPGFVQLSE